MLLQAFFSPDVFHCVPHDALACRFLSNSFAAVVSKRSEGFVAFGHCAAFVEPPRSRLALSVFRAWPRKSLVSSRRVQLVLGRTESFYAHLAVMRGLEVKRLAEAALFVRLLVGLIP